MIRDTISKKDKIPALRWGKHMKYAKQLFRQEYFVICQAFQTINLQDFDDLVKAWQNLD